MENVSERGKTKQVRIERQQRGERLGERPQPFSTQSRFRRLSSNFNRKIPAVFKDIDSDSCCISGLPQSGAAGPPSTTASDIACNYVEAGCSDPLFGHNKDCFRDLHPTLFKTGTFNCFRLSINHRLDNLSIPYPSQSDWSSSVVL